MPNLGSQFETFGILGDSGGGGSNLIEQGDAVITALGSPSVVFDGNSNLSVNAQDWIIGILCTATGIVSNKDIRFTACNNLLAAGFIGITELVSACNLDFTNSKLETIDFSLLENTNGLSLDLTNNNLGEFELPLLENFIGITLNLSGNDLISITFPALTNLAGNCNLNFSGNALPTSQVNAICTKLASAFNGASGTIDLSGGTNGKPTIVVNSPSIDDGGVLYNQDDPVVATGTGTGFICTIIIDNGAPGPGIITGFNLINQGSGYTSDTTFSVTSGTGSGAVLSGNFSDNGAITILKAGFTVTTN